MVGCGNGDSGVVVYGNQKAAFSIVVKCFVQLYAVPSMMHDDFALKHIMQLSGINVACFAAENSFVHIAHINARMKFGDAIASIIVKAHFGDVDGARKLFRQIDLLCITISCGYTEWNAETATAVVFDCVNQKCVALMCPESFFAQRVASVVLAYTQYIPFVMIVALKVIQVYGVAVNAVTVIIFCCRIA